jgi:hypothetical protein
MLLFFNQNQVNQTHNFDFLTFFLVLASTIPQSDSADANNIYTAAFNDLLNSFSLKPSKLNSNTIL